VSDRIIVVGKHSLTVTRIYNQYRVWCRPCGYQEWFDRRYHANEAADAHYLTEPAEPTHD
jgi:hypothetical protein